MSTATATRKTPPMSTTVIATPDGFDVTVEHAAHQSFSRAVQPRATREASIYMHGAGLRRATLHNVTHDSRRLGSFEQRVETTYHYAAS